MLLWTMPIEDIEFRHIDEVLSMKLAENNRLDYKAALPNELRIAEKITSVPKPLIGLFWLEGSCNSKVGGACRERCSSLA